MISSHAIASSLEFMNGECRCLNNSCDGLLCLWDSRQGDENESENNQESRRAPSRGAIYPQELFASIWPP